MNSSDVVIVSAMRSAIGRRNGSLSATHPNDLLGDVIRAALTSGDVDPATVDQVVGGCVQQVGAQTGNVTRNAWLAAGLPLHVPASTVNVQCGSSQNAAMIGHGFLGAALADVVVACGVETMSSVPLGSTTAVPGTGMPREGRYADVYEVTTQFQAADRIANAWGIERSRLDEYGARSQHLAAQAWAEDRFAGQIAPIHVRNGDGDLRTFDRDECLRDTSVDVLAGLRTNLADDGSVHTAGTSSQISDGAGALVMTTAAKAGGLGLTARARIVDSVLVGTDPVMMLTGPIDATRELLRRTGLGLHDIDVFEINEAFASVVLAWADETGAPMDRTNPNGGAIALGHPLGGTGAILLTKALFELERTGGRYALVAMCCAGGLGTGTIIERLDVR